MSENLHPDQIALFRVYAVLGRYVDEQTATDIINQIQNETVVFHMKQWWIDEHDPPVPASPAPEAITVTDELVSRVINAVLHSLQSYKLRDESLIARNVRAVLDAALAPEAITVSDRMIERGAKAARGLDLQIDRNDEAAANDWDDLPDDGQKQYREQAFTVLHAALAPGAAADAGEDGGE